MPPVLTPAPFPGSDGGAGVSDIAYAASWDGVTDVAPSKNAVYDKVQALDSVTDERIRDTIGTALVAGANVTLTVNDGADTITLAVPTEGIQDVVGALVAGSTGLTVTYDDAGNALNLTLDGDLTDLISRWVAASTAGPASLDFREDSDNGTNRARVQAPASLAGDVDLTLPSSTGTLVLTSEVFVQAQTVNAQTGTTYTLVAGDVGKLVTLSNASAITLTVPQDSDATFAVGTYVDLLQLGAGQVTVAAGTGATLRTSGLTAKARAQYSRLGLQKTAANTWSLFGDLAAS